MSLLSYHESKQISKQDFSFDAIIMAAMRQSDTANGTLLAEAFPIIWKEFMARYNVPGGRLEGEWVTNPLGSMPGEPKQNIDG